MSSAAAPITPTMTRTHRPGILVSGGRPDKRGQPKEKSKDPSVVQATHPFCISVGARNLFGEIPAWPTSKPLAANANRRPIIRIPLLKPRRKPRSPFPIVDREVFRKPLLKIQRAMVAMAKKDSDLHAENEEQPSDKKKARSQLGSY